MRLVGGAMTFPVPVGNDNSLKRCEVTVQHMEAQGQDNLAVVVWRNFSITQGIHAVDTLLLVFQVQEVLNFEQWEEERAAECHCYDFLVTLLEWTYIFFELFLFLFGLITTPHACYDHMIYIYSFSLCFSVHTITWLREVIIVLLSSL